MICIPITATSNDEALLDIERSCLIADAVEMRMDLIKEGILPELISAVRRRAKRILIIVTWRREEEAARDVKSILTPEEALAQKDKKIAMLKQAIELGADYIDIELACGDVVIEELKDYCRVHGGITGLIVSYHNFRITPSLVRLKQIFHQCRAFQPAVVKIVTYAGWPADNLRLLSLLPYARKYLQNIIALCMGDEGRISRMMASSLGNFLDFATLPQGAQSAPGQLTAFEMRQIYNLIHGDARKQKQQVFSPGDNLPQNYILLGNPIVNSLLLLMYNAALNDLGLDGCFNAFCVYDLAEALQGLRGMDVNGASVIIPFQSSVMEYLDDISADALKIGAVNTVINKNGYLTGANTDWQGVIATLGEALTIKGKKFVIFGAGAMAGAAVFGIRKEGGFPIIVDQMARRGQLLASRFDCPFYPVSEIGRIEAHCLINTTPVGIYPDIDKSPLAAVSLARYKYVMDVVYNPLETKMLKDARQMGCHIFLGLDMLVHQSAEQIKLWTGLEPSRDLMKKVVKERLAKIE